MSRPPRLFPPFLPDHEPPTMSHTFFSLRTGLVVLAACAALSACGGSGGGGGFVPLVGGTTPGAGNGNSGTTPPPGTGDGSKTPEMRCAP